MGHNWLVCRLRLTVILHSQSQLAHLKECFNVILQNHILVPRGRAPFGQHQESRPLARSNDILVLNGLVNTID